MVDISDIQPKLSRQVIMLLAASVCLIVSGLVAAITIVLNRGFGASDIWPFLFWSLPFAGGLAAIALFLIKLYCRLSLLIRYLVAALFGAASGVLWTYFVALLLGQWFGAFSFPVLSCWIAGGASGMVASAGGCTDMKRGYILVEMASVVLICLIVLVGTGPLLSWLSTDQNIEVIFVEWKPGPEPLSSRQLIPAYDKYSLTDKEIAQLESIGLTGELIVVGVSKHGEGKHSRAVIVMQHQLKESVELPQPDAVEIIYFQDKSEWKMYPANAHTLQRTILLEPYKHNPMHTRYMVELVDGTAQGGTAFTW